MRLIRRSVKAKRAYDASRRHERALQSQERIVETAQRRFLSDGYQPATVAAIAREAGVSVDSVYKSFGGKPGLIRAIYARALQGEGSVPAEQRSDEIQTHEPDAKKIMEAWGKLVVELVPRAAPIHLLVRSTASTDPELRLLLQKIDRGRHRRMSENAARLHAAGHLRPGVSTEDAADVLWTYSSPELYELLVLRRHMPLQQYGRFVAEAMIAALL